MRSVSFSQAFKTVGNSPQKSQMYSTLNSAATIDVESTIKQKIKTFTNWNYRTAILRKKKRQDIFDDPIKRTQTNNIFKNLIDSLVNKNDENAKRKGKKIVRVQQLQGVKSQRRQRFKHAQNPMQIIQHYIAKQGYKPSEQENILLGRIIDLKQRIDAIQPFNLQLALNHIYKTLNVSVDLNQTRFLILIAMMTGQVCFQAKQLKSSFFFLTQTMIAATCTRSFTIKLQVLVYMGLICIQIFQYQKAIIFFKKALQYAWKIKDNQTQLKLYDWIGQCLYYQGKSETALYYHNRYILGQTQNKQSAVRRISLQMLTQYQKTIDYTEQQNLNQLFIQYLSLPITNFQLYPPVKTNKIYQNYNEDTSPRKNRRNIFLDYKQLPQVLIQIDRILAQFNQFSSEIPNPDLHRNFVALQKYGRQRKNIDFIQSNDFHKIVGIKIKQFDKSILKLPTDQKAKKILQEKNNPHWWEDIKARSKKQRNNKLGSIRNKIQKTHLSHHKYPEERRRALSYKADKINETFNKTILNWIDPPKKGSY